MKFVLKKKQLNPPLQALNMEELLKVAIENIDFEADNCIWSHFFLYIRS